MRAAIMREFGKPLMIEEVELDDPLEHEVLIRTVASGICHTDLSYWRGAHPHPVPMLLGHEGCGIVEAVGAGVTNVQPGDHVITCMTSFCGHCPQCVTGNLVFCASPERMRGPGQRPRATINGEPVHPYGGLGSFAEKMLVYKNSCVKIRPDMPFEQGSVVGCGVMTGAGAVFNTAKVKPGESVVVIGLGGVGLSSVNGAQIAGAGRIIAVDLQKEKFDLAREFGATDVIDASEVDPVEAVMKLTGDGVDHAFEAVGLPKTAQQAFAMLRRGGAMTFMGMVDTSATVTFPGKDFILGKRVLGSTLGNNRFPSDIPQLVDFYMQGRLKLDALVSRTIQLDDINEALQEVGKGNVARSVIRF